ncbi:MAG: preprotein translocase subunit SecA, partial [Verrucomicrobiota bacterium]|nr:preprotein translocase subunit SecA [Verrucomicrobiota bacterium]
MQNLVSKQQSYCNKMAAEAKFELDSDDNDAESQQEAISKLWKVRLGMPKNKQLMRLNEVPAIRRLLDKFDLEMNSDFNKEQRYSIKEQLFYIIDEKQQQADLTEKGRNLISPNDPDAFMLPDLPTEYIEIDKHKELSLEERQQRKVDAEHKFQHTSERIHCISQLLRA